MFSESLLIVSGKGGVGKTALASALALESSNRVPTVLVSLDTQDARHPFFDVPLRYEPAIVRPGLAVCRVDALEAIREYVRRKVPFSALYDAFLKSRMFRDFAEAAPGFEELMCLGKVYDLTTGTDYQQVVFDAPATGHMKTLVDVPAATLEAVRVGPLNHNARKIQDLMLDPEKCRVVIAALPEEMAMREASELLSFCTDKRMNAGPILVNQTVAARFTSAELAALEELPSPSTALRSAVAAARQEAELADSQAESLSLVGGDARGRLVSIPRLTNHAPAALVEQLAATLEDTLKEAAARRG